MKKSLEKMVAGLSLLAMGCASIEDTASSDARVVVEPENPSDDDNIKAYVSDRDEAFTFYWVRSGVTYKIETGSYSTLNKNFTEPGDVWTVQAWVPESAFYDSFFYGSESVEID